MSSQWPCPLANRYILSGLSEPSLHPIVPTCSCTSHTILKGRGRGLSTCLRVVFFKKNIYLFRLRQVLVSVCILLVVACMWDLVPRPGIEPGPPALGAQSLTHWTTREVPCLRVLLLVLPFLPRANQKWGLLSLASQPVAFLPVVLWTSCFFSSRWMDAFLSFCSLLFTISHLLRLYRKCGSLLGRVTA